MQCGRVDLTILQPNVRREYEGMVSCWLSARASTRWGDEQTIFPVPPITVASGLGRHLLCSRYVRRVRHTWYDQLRVHRLWRTDRPHSWHAYRAIDAPETSEMPHDHASQVLTIWMVSKAYSECHRKSMHRIDLSWLDSFVHQKGSSIPILA